MRTSPLHPAARRSVAAAVVIVLLAAIQQIDARTGSAPFQHLYYVPIVVAGIELTPYGGVLTAIVAVVLYHLANPRLLTFTYAEADIIQITLFLAVGFVTTRLADDARRLRKVSETDDLTGLHNLRGFEPRLATMVSSARQLKEPVAMLVLDVDRLKALNDTHGHRAGADAVRIVGTAIATHLPPAAFACRFGGDEFVVALPGCDSKAAADVATAILQAVRRVAPTLAGLRFPEGTLSVSVGVAVSAEPVRGALSDDDAGETLFRTADSALYAAKAAGRNQISVAMV